MSKDKNIRPVNEYGQRHGLWEVYMMNGHMCFKCYFVNRELVGYGEWYSRDTNNEIKGKQFFLK